MKKYSFVSFIRSSYRFCALSLPFLAGCNENYAPMETVKQVEVNRYLGKWYQVAFIPNRFQSMCVADTQAEYQLTDNAIRVLNRCRTKDGSIEKADGIAKLVENSQNAKLRVSFFRPFYGNYWILDLDSDYQWVLVGEPSRQYAWILSRTPQLDSAVQQQLFAKAESLGYQRAQFQISPQTKPLN
ncbi:lipocalin family protein [Undibacterium fentianense]|uniref:Outer membrane lipoprotein Blc n=1 Tax=Undibacterium fentianense TaxID=2828728 RepID=A0A941IBF3_9BURK|nr:lipocalin family protein [Undibacterium fentianense]MBR7798994.1 lipocalin family protein [Undibacterium fentianense]